MTFDGWFALAVLAFVFYLLALTRVPADVALIAGAALMLLKGIITPSQALAGLSNESLVAVGVLYIVGAGVRETRGVMLIAERLFGRPKSANQAITRLMLPTAGLSAAMNNTPLVAMLIPAVNDWSKQQRIPASKLMIPLSYAAILGGTCTLIGTSTNLVVAAKVREYDLPPLDMFDITWIGLPSAIIGIGFIVVLSRWLLPDRQPALSNISDPREYTIEMLVAPDSPLIGKSIQDAGLRHLPGAYLVEIDRDEMVIPAVSPEERLRAGDRLVFVGIVESVIDLQKIRGLVPATDQVFKLTAPRSHRSLIEAVVSSSCPMVGKTIRDGRFRTHYDAVVIAVARDGVRIKKKVGDIVLEPGDTLLLEAHPSFAIRQRHSRDFLLVSRLENSNPPRHEKALLSLVILLCMVCVVAYNSDWLLHAAIVAAGLMIVTRCCRVIEARRSVDWEVLLAIAASFAIGKGLEVSGAANAMAGGMIGLAGSDPWLSLAVLYAVTLIVTELITNNAAAALMFPLALSTAATLGVSYMPYIITIMMAASAGFATPMGYQTNLMVYGPGGYRFSDYLRIGVPLDILVGVVTVAITPFVFPF